MRAASLALVVFTLIASSGRARAARAPDPDAPVAPAVPELDAIFDGLGAPDAKARREAADAFVAFVKNHGAASRSEIAQRVAKEGDRATAALIFAAHDPTREVARWASAELEAIGKRVPGDAVQTKSHDVLSDVLDAYGATKDLDALPAVLSFVNSDREQVRESARRATLAYGDAALAKLREAFGNLTGNPPAPQWTPDEVARELFRQDDRLRLQEVYSLMDAGLAAERAGKHGEAVAAFARVLARQPMFERRAEMAPAFVELARTEEETDPRSAEAHYRTASRLAPDGPRAGQVASALDYLEAVDLRAHGVTDEGLFRRAANEDPGNVRAHEELSRIEAERAARERTVLRYEEAAGVLVAILTAAVLLVGGRRSRA